ncbi:MAG: hypothetical protein K9L68_03035 [Spirochaetales bacterium]|nr:hypothetical protein [Spirochaetales bacterium]MCF7937551.1 hypothetical protein [Spirochaetales bacterium]
MKTLESILDSWFESQTNIVKTYRYLSKQIVDPGMRHLLDSLVDQEEQQKRSYEEALEQIRQAGLLEKELLDFDIQQYSNYSIPESLVAEEMLRFVIEREKELDSLLRYLAEEVPEEPAASLFQNFIEEHKRHKKWAEDRLDLMTI